jgi:hypothetical protein
MTCGFILLACSGWLKMFNRHGDNNSSIFSLWIYKGIVDGASYFPFRNFMCYFVLNLEINIFCNKPMTQLTCVLLIMEVFTITNVFVLTFWRMIPIKQSFQKHVMNSLVCVVHARNKFWVSDPSPKICKFYPLYSSKCFAQCVGI